MSVSGRPLKLPRATGNGCGCPESVVSGRGEGWQRVAARARLLAWLSLAYMAMEGAVAIVAAVLAGSVALLGFGLDSVIEGLASVIVVWRFTGARTLSDTAEANAQKAVAGLMTGSGVDVHQAMIATEKASMAFELSLAVRNKAIQAYQTVMGMQF